MEGIDRVPPQPTTDTSWPKSTWFACFYPLANVKQKPAEVQDIIGRIQEILDFLITERGDREKSHTTFYITQSRDQEYGGIRHTRRLQSDMVVIANNFYLQLCVNERKMGKLHIIAGESGAYLAIMAAKFFVEHGNRFQYDPDEFDYKWAEFLASGDSYREERRQSNLIGYVITVHNSLPSPSGIAKALWSFIRPPFYNREELQTRFNVINIVGDEPTTILESVTVRGPFVEDVRQSNVKDKLRKVTRPQNTDSTCYMPSVGNLFGIPSRFTQFTADPLGESRPPTSVQRTRSIYAIVIGINEYASPKVNNLEGAVPDALAVKKYLEEEFGVPGPQIRLLCDAEATRGNIIQEFNNLVADQHVYRDAPILIYYAGHGGEVDAPKDWEGGDATIQMLIPHDFRITVSGKEIMGIPDRTINALLSQVAERWGDNITVIFDSCHSVCGIRDDAHHPSRMARVTDIPHHIESDLDTEIWGVTQRKIHGPAIVPGFLHHGLRSHIFLAACGANEVAYEQQGALRKNQVNGVFTAALLTVLSAVRVGVQNVTYANLLQRLQSMTSQNPQCEGIHIDRALFNAKVHSQGRVLFEVKKDGDNYVMNAGTARGIGVGDEFTLYHDPHSLNPRKSPPLGTLLVRAARPFKSTMTPLSGTSPIDLDKPAFALLTKAGTKQDLRVYIADTKLRSFFDALVEMQGERPHHPRILEVEKQHAKLSIDLDDKRVVFDILDERVTTFSPLRIPSSVQLDVSKLHLILDAAAHFYWHLERTCENHHPQNKVHLEFIEVKQVKGKYDEDLLPVIEPIGKNLNQNCVVELVANDMVMHGIKIVNETAVPLYPSLFYFDNSNLSITPFYQPPFAGKDKVDHPLRPHGFITLGYGPGGGIPNIYTLNRGQDIDVGFLKLFLSTEYVDLTNIPQSSPFMSDQKRRVESAERFIEPISLWNTKLVTIVIRKK